MAYERQAVCQALAAMLRSHGEPNAEEVTFVGHAAFDLDLSEAENQAVQQTLKQGGDFDAFVRQVESKAMRTFLFRRVVTAALLDHQINEDEQEFIDRTARAFGYNDEAVKEFVHWIGDGVLWEQRGAEIIARL